VDAQTFAALQANPIARHISLARFQKFCDLRLPHGGAVSGAVARRRRRGGGGGGGCARRPGEAGVAHAQRALCDEVKVPALRVRLTLALQLVGHQLGLVHGLLGAARRAKKAAFDPRQARIAGTDPR